MYEERRNKEIIERWVNAQEECPSRKEAAAHFPNFPQRLIRSILQSRKDREQQAEQ